jgi:hypothetical protein
MEEAVETVVHCRPMLACKLCGEVRTISKTYKAGTVIYTLRYFICTHPVPDKAKAPPR